MKKEPHIKENNKNTLSTKVIIIFWLIVIVIGYIFAGKELALGLFIAAIISIIVWQYSVNSSWEGIIESFKIKKINTSSYEDDTNHYKEVKYAYIKLLNGKIKKIQAYPNWKIGDKIKKEKGEFSPKIIK
jgi:hypothetical protein